MLTFALIILLGSRAIAYVNAIGNTELVEFENQL